MESKGLKQTILNVLNLPLSSVALMGGIALIGLMSGFITYDGEEASLDTGQVMDMELPSMAEKAFNPNKYDNYLQKEEEEEKDLINLGNPSFEEKMGKEETPDGFASNESLVLDDFGSKKSDFNSREEIREHYDKVIKKEKKKNQQKMEEMTKPALLTAEELAERRQRDEALERAARLERSAVDQLEQLQTQRRVETQAPSVPIDNKEHEVEPSEPVANVTVANIDEYVNYQPLERANNAFYGLKGEKSVPEMVDAQPVPNAIKAAIHGDADNVTITNGSTIKLRLLQDIQVNRFLLPKNSLLTGECYIQGERIQVILKSVRVESSIIPIKLRVYDLDGHAGIYVPDLALKNQVAQTGSQAVTGGSLNMPYMVPSGGNVGEMVVGQTAAQGVNMAINGVRSVASKKISQQKATVRPNYQIYLKQE